MVVNFPGPSDIERFLRSTIRQLFVLFCPSFQQAAQVQPIKGQRSVKRRVSREGNKCPQTIAKVLPKQ